MTVNAANLPPTSPSADFRLLGPGGDGALVAQAAFGEVGNPVGEFIGDTLWAAGVAAFGGALWALQQAYEAGAQAAPGLWKALTQSMSQLGEWGQGVAAALQRLDPRQQRVFAESMASQAGRATNPQGLRESVNRALRTASASGASRPGTTTPTVTPRQPPAAARPQRTDSTAAAEAAGARKAAAAQRLEQQRANASVLRHDMQLHISMPIRSGNDLARNWNGLSLWYSNATAGAKLDLPPGVSLTSMLREGQTALLSRRADSLMAAARSLDPTDPQLQGKIGDIAAQAQQLLSFATSKRLPQAIQAMVAERVGQLQGMLGQLANTAAGSVAPGVLDGRAGPGQGGNRSAPGGPTGPAAPTTPPGRMAPDTPAGPRAPQSQATPLEPGAAASADSRRADPRATAAAGAAPPGGPPGPGGSSPAGGPDPGKKKSDWTKATSAIVEGTSTAFTALGVEYLGVKAALGEVGVFGDSVPVAGGQKLDMPKIVNEFSDANSLGPQGTITIATLKPGTKEADGHVFVVLNGSTFGSKVFKLDDIRRDLADPKLGAGHVVSHLMDYVDWNKINVIGQTLPDKGRTGAGARATVGGLGNITATVVTGTPEFGGMQKFGFQVGMVNGTARVMGANTSVTTLNKKTQVAETVNSGNLLGQAYANVYGTDARDPRTGVSIQSGLRFLPASVYVVRVKPMKFEANAWASTQAEPGSGRLSVDTSRLDPKQTRALTIAFNGNKYTELFDRIKQNGGQMDPGMLRDLAGDAAGDVVTLARDVADAHLRLGAKMLGSPGTTGQPQP